MPPIALVTGAAGFIGSHVATALLKKKVNVVALDDLSGGFVENVPVGARFVEGSITDRNLLANLFEQEKFDYVFHLAAYAAEGLSHFIRHYNYQTNLVGSINLINLSVLHHVKCFVFTSSIAVYGANQLPMTEDMTPHPEDPYGISKYAVELDLQAAKHQFGLDYVIFRPHNVYGEHQNIGDKYRNVVGIFMNQIMAGQALTIFGDGNQTRAFSYIDDVAPIIAEAVFNEAIYGEIFNIGGNQPYSINELAQTIAAVMHVKPTINYLPARNEVVNAYSSHEKITRFFNIPTATPLLRGLENMAIWAKQVGSRQTKEFGAIEISRGMPTGW